MDPAFSAIFLLYSSYYSPGFLVIAQVCSLMNCAEKRFCQPKAVSLFCRPVMFICDLKNKIDHGCDMAVTGAMYFSYLWQTMGEIGLQLRVRLHGGLHPGMTQSRPKYYRSSPDNT